MVNTSSFESGRRLLGRKEYDLTDHLGNVTTQLSDRKTGTLLTNDIQAQVLSYQQYFPFGWNMPGRSVNSNRARFGFNGKEDDEEWGIQDYGFRLYDNRLGKFLSFDPLATEYPWYTPYQFAGNMPTKFIDRDGLEPATKEEIFHSIFNPIDALAVKNAATEARTRAISSGLPNPRDGHQDAFRHTLWNAIAAKTIGGNEAKGFTDVHETSANSFDPMHADFDPVATEMDFHNNHMGRRIAGMDLIFVKSIDELEVDVLQAMANGELRMIRFENFEIKALNGNIIGTETLPSDRRGNPIVQDTPRNTPLINLLTKSGHTVNTNLADKQLIPSDHPTIPSDNSRVENAKGYDGVPLSDSYDK